MPATALAGALGVLALYSGAVLMAVQQIIASLAPDLAPIFLRKVAAWRIGMLLVLTGITGVVALPSSVVPGADDFRQVVALLLLMGTVGFGLVASYQVIAWLGRGTQLVLWLRHQRSSNASTLLQVFLNAARRGDAPVSEAALQVVRSQLPGLQSIFWGSVIRHPEALGNEWLTRQVLDAVLAGNLNDFRFAERPVNFDEAQPITLHLTDDSDQAIEQDTTVSSSGLTLEVIAIAPEDPSDAIVKAAIDQDQYVDTITELLLVIVVGALDREACATAADMIRAIMVSLARTSQWNGAHSNLVYTVGYALWNIGIPSAPVRRTERLPGNLKEVQAVYSQGLRKIWLHLLEIGDENGVEVFVSCLCGLFSEVSKEGYFLLEPRIFDIMQEGFQAHLLTPQAIQELANGFGVARHGFTEDDMAQIDIDRNVMTLAAMLKELGESDEAIWNALTHGEIHLSRRKGRVFAQNWLHPDSYNAIAAMLKRRGLHLTLES